MHIIAIIYVILCVFEVKPMILVLLGKPLKRQSATCNVESCCWYIIFFYLADVEGSLFSFLTMMIIQKFSFLTMSIQKFVDKCHFQCYCWSLQYRGREFASYD